MKRKTLTFILTVAMLLQTVALITVPAAAWSWRSDGKFVVPSYNAPIVDDGAIKVDVKLESAYLDGTKITSYPDEEPYKRNGYESVQDDAKADFFAYVAADTKGMYIYAEIEDSTIFPVTNVNGNDGDFFQIYLDWCTDDIKHPTPAQMYSLYNAGTPWDYASYKRLYTVNGLQYLGWISADYHGVISTMGGFAPYDKLGKDSRTPIVYDCAFTDTGWACEWFIPWRDLEQEDSIRSGKTFHCSLGFQACDDSDINDTVTPGIEQDVGIRYDVRKETGLSYYADYSRLSDIVFVRKCTTHSFTAKEHFNCTCTEPGYIVWQCSACKYEKTEVLAPAHNYGMEMCTVAGLYDVVCVACGYRRFEKMSLGEHDYSERHIMIEDPENTDVTCTVDGYYGTRCKYCSQFTILVTPAQGHKLTFDPDAEKYICSACDAGICHGDVNCDGMITNADVLAIYKYIFNSRRYPLPSEEVADANEDRSVTSADVLMLYKTIYNPEDYPVERKLPRLELGGADISGYVIVHPSTDKLGEKAEAERLASHIKETFGADVTVTETPPSGAKNIIFVGNSSSYLSEGVKSRIGLLSGYKVNPVYSTIGESEGIIWLAATNSVTLKAAVDKLISDTTPEKKGEQIKKAYTSAVSIRAGELGEELRVMSYNVQTGTPSYSRVTAMISNITSFMPDVLGTQEVNTKWIEHFRNEGLLDEYTLVGKPRDVESDTSNGNEYSAILYRTSKFDLLDSGTYWLSDTPTVVGSMHPSSSYIRIMTYAVLRRKSDGMTFLHVNCHLEWDSTTVLTNLIQTEIMLELTEGVLEENGDMPVFFTGDFNVTDTSAGYRYMINSGYRDSRKIADVTTTDHTFSGEKTIDFCFVSHEDFVVTEFDVGYGLAGSDHYPVYVKMHFWPEEN